MFVKIKKAAKIIRNEGGRALYTKVKNKYFCSADNEYIGIAPFEAEYQDNKLYDLSSLDIKAIAFYLPQFHAFKENDIWWGNGFTEWTNTRRCHKKRFYNHYQPRTPHKDIGYYDLSDFAVMEKQIKMAKEHGVYGFCFYYYWFSGRRLMEMPVDNFLAHTETKFPFCLCWANENWTRAWDGQKKDVLIEQKYADDDPERFIKDIKRYIQDDRYIRINGKPLIIVYNPGDIPDCSTVFNKWRDAAKRESIGEILIWVCATANNNVEKLNLATCVDAEVEFPPHNMWLSEFAIRNIDIHGKEASIFDYRKLVDYQVDMLSRKKTYCVPVHHTCTLGWDNSARRENNWFTLYGFSLKYYYKWLKCIADDARKTFLKEERFIFINAWNEWAEGTYLEPDEKYGYSYLNTTAKALCGKTFEKYPCIYDGKKTIIRDINPRVCVQFHIYYVELLEEIVNYLNNISFQYDCFISTDTIEKKRIIESYFNDNLNCDNILVQVFENKGRDVRPFLMQLNSIARKYDYVGHFHSKITSSGDYGDDWRKYCYKHLLGDRDYINCIMNLFDTNPRMGIAFPPVYPPLINQAVWGGNRRKTEELFNEIGIQYQLPTDAPVFPVGNMFWARTSAILPLFERLDFNLFPEEIGQTNSTIAHSIERAWVYVAKSLNYDYEYVFNSNSINSAVAEMSKKSIAIFVHYDSNNKVSDNDIEYMNKLKCLLGNLVVVSNNNTLDSKYKEQLSEVADLVIYRENLGYDFAAWRDAIHYIGRDEIEQYDVLFLVNNSMLVDVEKLENILTKMNNIERDFWGMTLFPALADGAFCSLDYIPEHIQSYFMAFNKLVINDDRFYSFWNEVKDENEITEVIAKYESQLTSILSNAGYTYDVFLQESRYINNMIGRFDLLYTKPWMFLLLGLPFVKKKYKKLALPEDIEKTEYYFSRKI